MHDVAPGFLRPNPNPSSQDVPGPWFRLLYIIHPHQSMIPCLSGRRHPSELQEPAHGFLLLVCYRSLRGRRSIQCSTACISMALFFLIQFPWRYQTFRLVFVAFGILLLYLYYLACTISSIDLMVTMMTTIMFCFLAKKKTIW